MAYDKVGIAAVNAVNSLLQTMPDESAQVDALDVMMMTNYNLLRDVHGDEFVRAWLQTALRDLDQNPPVLGLPRAN